MSFALGFQIEITRTAPNRQMANCFACGRFAFAVNPPPSTFVDLPVTISHPADRIPAPEIGLTIGFVGGVGSGKSAVAASVAHSLESFGVACTVLDGDRVGHETLGRAEVIAAIADAFGSEVIADGEVCRSSLAKRVFGAGGEHQSAREVLEAIMHPVMKSTFAKQIASTTSAGRMVLFDAAILFEAGWNELCDACVFVDVPAETRKTRALGRGWTVERWSQTEASQWSIDRKREAVERFGDCGLVAENSSQLAEVGQQVAEWIVKRLVPSVGDTRLKRETASSVDDAPISSAQTDRTLSEHSEADRCSIDHVSPTQSSAVANHSSAASTSTADSA